MVLLRYNIDKGIRKLVVSLNRREKIMAEELFQTIYEYRIIKCELAKRYGEREYYNSERTSMEIALDRKYKYVRDLMEELQKSLGDNSITFLLTSREYFLVSKTEIIYSKLIKDKNENDKVI